MRMLLLLTSIFMLSVQPALAKKTTKAKAKEAKERAFEAEMLKLSYLDIEEKAQKDKQIARYIAHLKKKGITNSAHFEQYKVRIRVEGMRKYRPRRWSETGHSDTRIQDPYKEKKPKKDPNLPEAKERW